MNSVRLRRFHVLFGIILTLVAVPLLLLAAIIYIFWFLLLRFLVIVLWIPRGLRVLVVYSNSPHWKQRFEERILPQLGPRCVVLNWSERRRWSLGLAECLFWFYGGAKNYNPLAVVIRPSAGRRSSAFGRHSAMPSMVVRNPCSNSRRNF